MNKERVRELLADLDQELQNADELDDETRMLLKQLNDDLDDITDDNTSALDRANELETRFAAEHPVATRFAREFADLLSKMGI